MEQVFVTNPKGGCGKTTISAQLAAYFAVAGKRGLLGDHDELKCSSDWMACRPSKSAKIGAVIADGNKSVDGDNVDWVVHDMPAAWSLDKAQSIISSHDKVLIPVLSSPNDVRACLRFIMRLHRSGAMEKGITVGLIANRARTTTSYYKVLEKFLSRLGLPIVTVLRDTQNYVKAMDAGLSIFDLPPSRMRLDLDQWQPLIRWLCQK